MEAVKSSLRDAFETHGYDIAELTVNRDRVRVAVLDPEASAEALQSATFDAVDEDDVLGLDVTTESADSQDGVTTVVSFRYRG